MLRVGREHGGGPVKQVLQLLKKLLTSNAYCDTIQTKREREGTAMLRLRIDKANGETEHRFFTDAQKAHLTAIVEIRSGDAVRVEVMNLAEKKVEKIYKKG